MSEERIRELERRLSEETARADLAQKRMQQGFIEVCQTGLPEILRERDEAVAYAGRLLAMVEHMLPYMQDEHCSICLDARATLAKSREQALQALHDNAVELGLHPEKSLRVGPAIVGPGLIEGCEVCGNLRCECNSAWGVQE